MNDFTKEELNKILYIFDDWESPMRHESIWMSLKNKVVDMIDNYCDHKMFTPSEIVFIGKPMLLKPKGCRCNIEFGCGGGCNE